MTKYSLELKKMIVNEYLSGEYSLRDLSRKYGMHMRSIQVWLEVYENQGADGLKIRKKYNHYSSDLKLDVIDYYESHDLSLSKVGIHFGIPSNVVTSWYVLYKEKGKAGLLPKPKGRPVKKLMDNNNNENKEKRKYAKRKVTSKADKVKIHRLEQELKYAKMENDILKKLNALRNHQDLNKLK